MLPPVLPRSRTVTSVDVIRSVPLQEGPPFEAGAAGLVTHEPEGPPFFLP
jgi:hypothetical protein